LCVVEIGWNRNHGTFDALPKVGLRRLLHSHQNHGRDLFGAQNSSCLLPLDRHTRLLAVDANNLVGEQLHVGLDGRIIELAADEALDAKYRVARIVDGTADSGFANKAIVRGE
jgi:hypothetical protein